MKTVYPGVTVAEIYENGGVRLEYTDGGIGFVNKNDLPEDTKVGDIVTVTIQNQLDKIESAP